MPKILLALLRATLALILLFLTAGLIWTLVVLPLHVDASTVGWPALLGFLAGVIFFTLVSRVLVVYVFGHELTHWFAAKFFLRETGDLQVGTKGGSVAVAKPNIWITLAPYFVPFYTLIWIGIYGLYRFAYGQAPPAAVLRVAYGGIGFTYAFHVVLTIYSLTREQADLRAHGPFLSLSLILFFNTLILAAGLLTVSNAWGRGVEAFLRHLGFEYQALLRIAQWLWEALSDLGRTLWRAVR